MSSTKITLTIVISIGIINFLLWKFSGVSLSNEMPPDYSVLPHPTTNSNKEIFIYSIFSFLFSICFYTPFYLNKKYSNNTLKIGMILSLIFFIILIKFISSNTKGILLSNWFGEDYGFSINIIKAFLIAPVVFFVLNRIISIALPIRSLFYLFIMSFAIYSITKVISYPLSDSIVKTIRHILMDGYFITLYSIAFGLISLDANKKFVKI